LRIAPSSSAACRSLVVAVLAALAAGFAGCGEEDSATAGDADAVGEVKVGSVAPLAQCRDWNKGTEAEKLATIEDVRSQVNLEDAPVDSPPLSDEEAFEMFENACAAEFADGFRLYKLYANAAAFAPLSR
jgi:hypothetical protein